MVYMKEAILAILKSLVPSGTPINVSVSEQEAFGHYSTNVAMRLAKAHDVSPMALAGELAEKAKAAAPTGFFERVEAAAPGFVNFWLSQETLQDELREVSADERYGMNGDMKGRMIMVEFTDPNPFKLFHIGHLMSNTIGESFARLYEASGAKVVRANYQGDVGLHVAKALWGMEQMTQNGGAALPDESAVLAAKMEFLGKAYASGARAYDENPADREAIGAINEKIYLKNDQGINTLYAKGRAWSLEYFETIYERLGTKFDHYFFESEAGKEGMELVRAHAEIFKESDGAIVFPGEQYGLHTRVFVNSKGLPTYETKELGLNREKFERYPLDLSVIVTGNEIVDYFKVLMKAMELIFPDIARKTRHVSHGMLRLPGGKMSSRTGDVITAESLLDQVKEKLKTYMSEKADLTAQERETVAESIAVGAVKYSILKQNPGQDIVFDFDASLSFEGDSGPYLQYAYARLKSILRKSKAEWAGSKIDFGTLDSESERALMRKIFEFPDVVARAREKYTPSALATYLHKLASVANKFYETTPILKDDNEPRIHARLALIETAARVLRLGLGLFGIQTPEKI